MNTCTRCHGSGWTYVDECARCCGAGTAGPTPGPVEEPLPDDVVARMRNAALRVLVRLGRVSCVEESASIARSLGMHAILRTDPTRLVRERTGLAEHTARQVARACAAAIADVNRRTRSGVWLVELGAEMEKAA